MPRDPNFRIVKQLPYRPQPLEELQERFVEALDPIFDVESLQLQATVGPSMLPKHIMDGEDGLRIIVGRLRLNCGRIVTYYCAAILPESALAKSLSKNPVEKNLFAGTVFGRFWQLVNLPIPIVANYIGDVPVSQFPQFVVQQPKDLLAEINRYRYGNAFDDASESE